MNTTSSNQLPLPEQSVALDADADTMARRYVRITGRSANGFVTFEFSVGWPDMSVELALPEDRTR
jgi:phenol hydroxylase P0 protein